MVGYLAVVTIGLEQKSVGFTVSPDVMPNLPARFDAGWYRRIALDGYYFEGRFDKQQNVAFFPAFPLLERAAGYPLGALRARRVEGTADGADALGRRAGVAHRLRMGRGVCVAPRPRHDR